MKPTLSTLIILSLCFVFTACQPEEAVLEDYVAVEYTGAEYLSRYRTPSAMFVVAHQNLETKERSGFLIDNTGNLKRLESISFALNPEGSTVHPPLLQSMIDKGETVDQIDLDILVEQFKKIRLAARARTIQGEGNPNATENVEFYGITLGVPGYSGAGNCQGAPSSSSYYSLFMLKSEGLTSSFLNSGKATELTDWLKGINSGVK